MAALVTAALVGMGLLTLAIWIEIRERRSAPGDGTYRSPGKPGA